MDKQTFLAKYNISNDKFDSANITWEQLMEIYNDYILFGSRLEPTANYIADCLRKSDKVHSIKLRVKDPEHLIEKIIRKKIKDPNFEVNINNYKEKITDLIGIRALHLFKEDWEKIHNFIVNTWDIYEQPKANIREGDAEELFTRYKEHGCEIVVHPFGYRSVHYLISVYYGCRWLTYKTEGVF